jgi:hypothetical protein
VLQEVNRYLHNRAGLATVTRRGHHATMTTTPDRMGQQPAVMRRPVRGIISVACAIIVNLLFVVSRTTSFDFLDGQAKQLALFAATTLTGVALIIGVIAGGLALIVREPRQLAAGGLVANLVTALVLLGLSLQTWF